MGDYYEILRSEAEATEAYYLDQADHYDAEPDEDDWLTGPPWQEADEDTPF